MTQIPKSANRRPRSRRRARRLNQHRIRTDAAKELPTTRILIRSAPQSIMTWPAMPQRSVIGMRAMMPTAPRPLNRHRRHSHQHPLIPRDAVMAMVHMLRSATVWMSDHVTERQTATGWKRMIPRNANQRRPPHRRHRHMLRDAVLDILREHSRSAMRLKAERTVNRPECAHGLAPMIPMNVSHQRQPQRLLLQPSIPLVAALETRHELGHSVRALTRC